MEPTRKFKPFSFFSTPLAGRHLIESSAGTGKTYTITALLLRLLLEKKIPIQRILIVTFTKAATEDLKKRSRTRLREALDTFEQGPGEDAFLNQLLENIQEDKSSTIRLLRDALLAFDEAAIFTIHGFCQRVLAENAFESSSLFNTEVLTDSNAFRQEIVEDFWRLNLLTPPSMFVEYFLSKEKGLQQMLSFARLVQPGRKLKVIPPTPPPNPDELREAEEQFLGCISRVQSCWIKNRTVIQDLIVSQEVQKQLNKSSYKPVQIQKYLDELDCYLIGPRVLFTEKKGEKLSANFLKKGTNKNCVTPQHPLFDLLDQLQSHSAQLMRLYEQKRCALKSGLLEYVEQESHLRKLKKNCRTFDDLLSDVYEALQGESGRTLKQVLRQRFQAALIDEFQDTDSLQNAIFDAVFSLEDHALFLIGDPKQAIYSFRGADIFSYLAASHSTSDCYSLGKNWRSSPRLIQAVNTLFLSAPAPFIFPQITFSPVEAARDEFNQGFLVDGEPDPAPLKVWFLRRSESAEVKLMSKEIPLRQIPPVVSAEIGRLLEEGLKGSIRIKGIPIQPGDIAVLVLSNRQAQEIQGALTAAHIPSVLYTTGSVFATREAGELERLLSAILDPSRERNLRAALATSILGMKGDDLLALEQNEEAWEEQLQQFLDYQAMWSKEGFIVMARRLIDQETIRPRLLSYPDGERRLTNLMQCIELIQLAATEHHLEPEGAYKWLRSRITEEQEVTPEEHQTRLETDEQAVKVVTIHRSKGLEYPVVFCPYNWYVRDEREDDEVLFHATAENSQLSLDLGSPNQALHRAKSQEEALSERARLLYVALTRAQYRCYLSWGGIKQGSRSALSLLLHAHEIHDTPGWMDEFTEWFKKVSDEQILADLNDLAQRSGGTIEILSPPESGATALRTGQKAEEKFSCRVFQHEIPSDWGIASFTSLVSGRKEYADSADRDISITKHQGPLPISGDPARPYPVTTLLSGAKAGNFFHALLEELDFTTAATELSREYLTQKLAEYGYNSHLEPEVKNIIQNLLRVPLGSASHKFQLCQIPAGKRRHEVEFTLPLDRLTPKKLTALFKRQFPASEPDSWVTLLQNLEFRPIQGQLHGFIDLVFEWQGKYYLIDWKSNLLGPDSADYHPSRLAQTISQNYYFLQYYLYCAAMHRYLRQRLPGYEYDRHFGGVYYLFLRGIKAAGNSSCGVFFDRPEAKVVEALSELLQTGE
jgi:exodeoxyribonuclease V beta subunit